MTRFPPLLPSRGRGRGWGATTMAGILLALVATAPAHSVSPTVPTEQAAPVASWSWPIPAPHRIIAPFAAPADRYSAGHRGIDLAQSAGDPVAAPADATVHFAGRVVDRDVLTLETGDGALISFEPISTSLHVGEHVTEGGRIGSVASGGHCDERCLHVGVRVDGRYVSPMLFFAGVPRAVLLPMP